jgi:hypothetical protein
LTGRSAPGGGYRDPIELAREKVDWILENHHPQSLDRVQQHELRRILSAADREFTNQGTRSSS